MPHDLAANSCDGTSAATVNDAAPAEAVRRRRFNPRVLGRGWRRRTRWIWRVLLGGPLLILVLLLLLSRSPLVASLARGAIEPLLGCRMEAASVAISLDGRLIIDDMSLHVPGMRSPASEFLFVKRAEAELDWSGVLSGEIRPTGLRLHQPTFRVSQSTTSGQVSIAELRPVAQTKQRLTQPPRIDVLDGVVEIGEHTPAAVGIGRGRAEEAYRALMRLNVSGNLAPSDPLRPIYTVRLQEQVKVRREGEAARPNGSPATASEAQQYGVGMVVDGKIDLDHSSARMRVLNIGLNPWPDGAVPTYMRDVWTRLNIRGRISEAILTFDPSAGPEATVKVDRVAMEALVPAAAHSGKIDDMLSLDSVVGTITVSTNRLTAELDAIVEGQSAPAHVSLNYGGLTEDAPFRCVITTHDFRVDKDPGWLAFTPVEVKENLAAFSGPTGLIRGEVVIERAAPVATHAPAPVNVTGKLNLSEGTAAFHRVPYPFKHMTAYVEFDQDKITLTRVDGRADSGATVHASGWIAPPDESAEISLHITVNNIPLDQVFTDSLPASRKGAMAFLFCPEQHAALRRAGLVADPGSKALAGRALADYSREWDRLAALTPDDAGDSADAEAAGSQLDEAMHDTGERIADAQRVLRAPEFDVGGVADLDIRVHSPPGKESSWKYTVLVSIPKAGFLLRGFPLPVVATDTLLKITEDTATLLEGSFEGLAGGKFEVDAEVVLERDGLPVVLPEVRLRAHDVPINEYLLFAAQHARSAGMNEPAAGGTTAQSADAAAPAANDLGRAAEPIDAAWLDRILDTLDLSGRLSCDASIWPDADGSLDARGSVSFTGAQLGPVVLGDGSRLWASGVEGLVLVDSERVSMPWLRGGLSVSELAGSIERPVMAARSAGAFQLFADASWQRSLGAMLSPYPDEDTSAAGGTGHVATVPGAIAGRDAGPAGAEAHAGLGSLRQAEATLILSDVDASLDLSPLVRAVSADAGASIGELMQSRRPRGRLDAELHVGLDERGAGRLHAQLLRTRGFSLSHAGDRIEIDLSRGCASLHASLASAEETAGEPSGALVLDGCTFQLRSPGDEPLTAWADGVLPLAGLWGTDSQRSAEPDSTGAALPAGAAAGIDLRLHVQDATFESCLVREFAASRLGGETLARVDSLDPRGTFDLDARLAPALDAAGMPTPSIAASGSLRPTSVSLQVQGARLTIPSLLGEVMFDGGRIWTSGLALAGERWSAVVQAERAAAPGGTGGAPNEASVRVAMVGRSGSLSPAIRSMLPESVRARLDESRIAIDGPLALAPLVYTSVPGSAAGGSLQTLAGAMEFSQLSLDGALEVREAAGRCEFTLSRPAGQEDWSFDTRLVSPRLILAGLDVRSVDARVLTGSSPDVILIPGISAECYTGRISGSGSLRPAAGGLEPGGSLDQNAREYRGEVSLAGVRFAPILDAVGAEGGAAAPTARPTAAPSSGSRGSVDAAVSFSGVLGRPETRSGLGSVRISGGDVVRMPLVLTLMQLSNFQLPAKDSFDFLQTSFQLAGEQVTFDQIALISRTLAITGYGTMTWPGRELDLRFNSRSAGRVPLLSDVVEALRNEVVTTRITGTLMDPSIDPEALLGTRQLINSALGQSTGPRRSISEQQADEAARAERNRLKGASSRVPSDGEQ